MQVCKEHWHDSMRDLIVSRNMNRRMGIPNIEEIDEEQL